MYAVLFCYRYLVDKMRLTYLFIFVPLVMVLLRFEPVEATFWDILEKGFKGFIKTTKKVVSTVGKVGGKVIDHGKDVIKCKAKCKSDTDVLCIANCVAGK